MRRISPPPPASRAAAGALHLTFAPRPPPPPRAVGSSSPPASSSFPWVSPILGIAGGFFFQAQPRGEHLVMPAGTTGRSWGTAMGGGWLCWLALWQPQVTRASVSPLLHGERLSYHPPAWALGQAGPQGEPGGGGWWHLLAMGQGRVTPSPMAGVPPPQQTPVTHPLPLQYPTSPVAPQRFMVPGTVALGCVCVSPPRGPPPRHN